MSYILHNYRSSPKPSQSERSYDDPVVRLFEAMEVVLDRERFLIQATRLPWFQRTQEELEIAAGAAQNKVGPDEIAVTTRGGTIPQI